MRHTLLAIAFAFTGIQCIETNCHPGPACDPNAQVAAQMQVVGTDCGTFTIDNNVITNPNAAICAHTLWQNSNFPFTFTFRAIAGNVMDLDVYMVSSQANITTLQGTTTTSSDGNKLTLEVCNSPTWFASSDVQDPCSPNYGNYQFQCTTYTNPNVICSSAQVCD